jgi:hypothetical protein
VETGAGYEYKAIAEKQVTNRFYSPLAYVTSLCIAHIPFSIVIVIMYYT